MKVESLETLAGSPGPSVVVHGRGRSAPGRAPVIARAAALAVLGLALGPGCGVSETPTPGWGGPGSGSGGGSPGSGGTAGTPGAGGSATGGASAGRGGSAGGGRGGAAGGRGGSASGGAAGSGGNAGSGGTPGAAGDGVDIGGRRVPRDKVVVFLHIGHSNMAGRSQSPASERPFFYETHPQLWSYRDGTFRPAVEPLSGDSMTRGRAGPGMAILRAALTRAPDATIVSIGRGQSGQTGGYCQSYRKGGLLYDFTMGPAMQLRGKVTFGAVFVMFGISEVNDEANVPNFGACAEAVVNDMRGDLGQPDLPFVFGDWEAAAEGSVAPDSEVGGAIVPQLRALPGRVPRLVVIPTEGLPLEEEDHHYTLLGQKLWAERGFTLLEEKGLMPWASAP